MSGKWGEMEGPAGPLRSYAAGAPRESGAPLLLLCPELPTIERGRHSASLPYEAVAERISQESGWRVVVGMLRGLGGSAGSFSGPGWLEDAAALVEAELGRRTSLRAAGFGLGAAVALALGGDERVRGVACFAAPVGLTDWTAEPTGFAERCRRAGVLEPGFPPDPAAWASGVAELEPIALARRLEGTSVLVVHGSEDDTVPAATALELVAAAGPRAELRVVLGAGHWLMADPRATATLIGWLERQS